MNRSKHTSLMCTFAMSVIPEWQEALRRAVSVLKPGGVLAIADAKLTDRWYARILNPIADLMGLGAAGYLRRGPWEEMPALLEDVQNSVLPTIRGANGVGMQEYFMGFFYVASGRKGEA